jgi:small subunit ribosomal protein S18
MAEEQKQTTGAPSAPPRRDGGGGHGGGHSGGGHSGGGHSGGSHGGPRREGGGPGGAGPGGPRRGKRQYFRKKKVCKFCVEKMDFIDYKRADILSQFVQERGKILPRRMTGVCSRHQRWLGVAIKRARNIALLPFAGSAAGTQQPRAVLAQAAGAPAGSSAGTHAAAPAAAVTPAATAPTEVSNA